ncbi:hypothetical protein ACOMHN_004446 [Nucella lapillus]
MCWRPIQDVLASYPRCAGVLSKMCWRPIQDMLASYPICAGVLSKMCWRPIQDVLASYPSVYLCIKFTKSKSTMKYRAFFLLC